jgi:hypothetical protein
VAGRASRLPSPAAAGGGPAPGGPRVCRCVVNAARRARSGQLACRAGPFRLRPTGCLLVVRVCAVSGASRLQDKHARLPFARRASPPRLQPAEGTWRPVCVPPAVHRDGKTSTLRAVRALLLSSRQRPAGDQHLAVRVCGQRCFTTKRRACSRAARAQRPPSLAAAGGGPAPDGQRMRRRWCVATA